MVYEAKLTYKLTYVIHIFLIDCKRLCNMYRCGVVWGAKQSPIQLQRTAALEGRASPAGPSAHPPEGNSPTQHSVRLWPDNICRYLYTFTIHKLGYQWFAGIFMTFRWFVHHVVGEKLDLWISHSEKLIIPEENLHWTAFPSTYLYFTFSSAFVNDTFY